MFDNHINLKTIQEAHKLIRKYAHWTPIFTSKSINELANAEIYFKCENFQKVGAFKFRGAVNAIFSLAPEDAKKGVATHSSGNHAQAVALAAKLRGIPAHIVMPSNSPNVKKAAVAGYGADIIYCEPTQEARERTLENVVADTGATFIHPYNDYKIIAGQGTAALEMMKDVPGLEIVLAPVSGGGLMSGTCIAVAALSPKTTLIGVEPELADDAYRSLKENRIIPSTYPDTIADGLRMSLGTKTFPILKKYLDRIITVSDEQTITAMRYIWERMKIIIEPSSAVPLAAILSGKYDFSGKKIGVILSGGNVDLEHLPF